MFTHPTMLAQLTSDRIEAIQAEAHVRHQLRAARRTGREGNAVTWLHELGLHLFGPRLARAQSFGQSSGQ